jgi:hypothetical protein
MILDANLIFSENQAVTATAISQNVVRVPNSGIVPYEGAAIPRNLGPGREIPLLVQVTTSFATLTSLTITLETADNDALSTNAQVIFSTGAIPAASLVRGYRIPIRVLPDFVLRDFLGLRYTVAGSNATAGAITAAITMGVNAP